MIQKKDIQLEINNKNKFFFKLRNVWKLINWVYLKEVIIF